MSQTADTDAEKTKCRINIPEDNFRTTRFCFEENEAHVNNGKFISNSANNENGSCLGCIKDMGVCKKKIDAKHDNAQISFIGKRIGNEKTKTKAQKNISKEIRKNQVKANKQIDDEICFKVWNIFGLKQSKISKIKNKADKFLNDIFETSDFVVYT